MKNQGRPGMYLKNQGRPGELVDTRYTPPFFMDDGMARPIPEDEDNFSSLYREMVRLQYLNFPHQDMGFCDIKDELVNPELCMGWIDPENRPRGR